MEEIKFSIVVPVYNVEEYIEDCILSIKQQTYTNWELILVNDGSEDKSAQICENFAKEDKRIIVINQDNQGVSQARNRGIRSCTGDYITFIDGDDSWNEDILSELQVRIQSNQEIEVWLATRYRIYYPSGDNKIITRNWEKEDSILSMEDGVKFILESKWSVWLAFVKREVINKNGIYFNGLAKLGEDADWMFRVCLASRFMALFDTIYYKYNVGRSASAMTSKSQKVCMSYLEVIRSWIEWYERENSHLIYLITKKLANNCAEYISYVYSFERCNRERWRKFVVKYKMYDYLDSNNRKVWKHFDSKIFFQVYIYYKSLRRNMAELYCGIIKRIQGRK